MNKKLYCLKEVPFEEAQADIRTYLKTSLLHVGDKAIEQVVTATAGLFIYASTIIKYLGKHTAQEQRKLLKKPFSISTTMQIFPGAMALLDKLYIQILLHAFDVFKWTYTYTDCISSSLSSVLQSVPQHPSSMNFSLLMTSTLTLYQLLRPIQLLPKPVLQMTPSNASMLCSTPKTTKFYGTTSHFLTSSSIRISQKTFGVTRKSIIDVPWTPAFESCRRGCDSILQTLSPHLCLIAITAFFQMLLRTISL